MRIAFRSCLLGIGYVGAYVALDAFSFVQPLLKLGITPWNPDAGLTLAFLLFRGWRQVPWVAAAALSAELLVRDVSAPLSALICASVIIAIGYGALAFTLLRRGLDRLLASRRSALEFSFETELRFLWNRLSRGLGYFICCYICLNIVLNICLLDI